MQNPTTEEKSIKKADLCEAVKAEIEKVILNPVLLKMNLLPHCANVVKRSGIYMSALFRKSTGETLQNYYVRRRVETVCDKLVAGQKLTEIAFDLRYSNVAHVSNQFKKVMGQSPTRWLKAREAATQTVEAEEAFAQSELTEQK